MLEYFSNKFTGLQAGIFITKRVQHSCFAVNIAKFLKESILKDICERLLLNLIDNRRRIQNPLKHLRQSFLRK